MDVPGVAERFRDELDLLGALHLKWHTRLAGHIESEHPCRPYPVRVTGLRQRIPEFHCPACFHPEFVTEVTGIAGPRYVHR